MLFEIVWSRSDLIVVKWHCNTIEKQQQQTHNAVHMRSSYTPKKKCKRTVPGERGVVREKERSFAIFPAIFAHRAYGTERFGVFVENRTYFCFNSHLRAHVLYCLYCFDTGFRGAVSTRGSVSEDTRLAAMRAYSAYAGEITQSRTEVCTVAGKHCNPVTRRLRGLSATDVTVGASDEKRGWRGEMGLYALTSARCNAGVHGNMGAWGKNW